MTEFLSDDWIEAFTAAGATLDPRDGVAGVVQVVVAGAPGGKVQLTLNVDGGRVGAERGKADDPMATLTWKYPEAVAIFSGEIDPDEAFMLGRTKVEGDYAAFLQLLRPVFGPDGMATLRDALGDVAY